MWLPACRRGREAYLTYFGARYAVSVRYPATWTTQAAEGEGTAYRYFIAPGVAADPSSLSASLIHATTADGFDAYAARFVEGAAVTSTKDETRLGARGRSYLYSKSTTRYGLVLLREAEQAHGLFIQGHESRFEAHRRDIDEMMASFALERPDGYPQTEDVRFGFSLKMPPSWREARKLSSANSLMMQFLSPTVGVDRDRSTVHVSFTVSAEPLAGGGIEAFYAATRRKLGEAYKVTSHKPWKDGYVDSLTIETPMAMSQARHFYRVSKDRGYALAFEGRDDVFFRVSAWCDLIASTFELLPAGGA